MEAQETGVQGTPSKRACQFAMGCHLIALIGLFGNGIGFLVGPLVLWLVMRKEDPFIDEQGKEAVNFQITVLIAALVSALLIFVIIGFFLLFAIAIYSIIMVIIAAIKASEGVHFRYPISIRFIK